MALQLDFYHLQDEIGTPLVHLSLSATDQTTRPLLNLSLLRVTWCLKLLTITVLVTVIGAQRLPFRYNTNNLMMIDVGGQVHEMTTWEAEFNDVLSVIYMVSLSGKE